MRCSFLPFTTKYKVKEDYPEAEVVSFAVALDRARTWEASAVDATDHGLARSGRGLGHDLCWLGCSRSHDLGHWP